MHAANRMNTHKTQKKDIQSIIGANVVHCIRFKCIQCDLSKNCIQNIAWHVHDVTNAFFKLNRHCQTDRHTDTKMDRQIDRQIDRQKGRQIDSKKLDGYVIRWIDKQMEGQRDEQIDMQICRQMDEYIDR